MGKLKILNNNNNKKIKVLLEFRKLVDQYLFLGYAPCESRYKEDLMGLAQVKNKLKLPEFKEMRKLINKMKPAVTIIISECGVPNILTIYPPPAIGGPVINFRIFDLVIQNQAHENLEKDFFLDKIDEAIGALEIGVPKLIQKDEIKNLKDFIVCKFRSAVFNTPTSETQIQNILEQLLIGKGLTKGIDYDRESGRVKISSKEVIPDFIFLKINLALEVKFIKDKSRINSIIDEINSDIISYLKKYSKLFFVIYDLGFIQNENEFKNDLEQEGKIFIIIIKH